MGHETAVPEPTPPCNHEGEDFDPHSPWHRRRIRLIAGFGVSVITAIAAHTVAKRSPGSIAEKLSAIAAAASGCWVCLELTWTIVSDIARGDWRRWGGSGCLYSGLIWPFLAWAYSGLVGIVVWQVLLAVRALGR